MIKATLSFLLLFMITCSASTALAWNLWGNSKPLLTVNSQHYQTEDFLNWWREWREDKQPPSSIDPYVDWILLAQEAEQMQLHDQPSYQKKVATFLRVRSLMLFKNEEIDDKITPPDDGTLYDYYLQNFTPRWQLQTVTFRKQADLDLFVAAHAASPESKSEDLLAKTGTAATDYLLSSPVWERPNHLPEKILSLLEEAQDQRFSSAYPWNNTWQILEILAKEPASDADFSQLRNTLKPQYLKQQRATLTAELLQQLKKKYPVKINQEILATLHAEKVPEDQAQVPVLEFLSYKITAAELQAAALKQYNSLAPQQQVKTPFAQILQRVISAIVSQNLVDAEALDRHYEQHPPFKSTFDFYRNHRLIRELERQIIQPEVKAITPEAVKESYEQYKVQLSGPAVVEIVRGETKDHDLAVRLHAKLRQGEDFAAILTVLGYKNAEAEKLPLNHLSTPLQKLLDTLQPGQSDMVEDGDNFIFVRLLKPLQQEIVAFDSVKDSLEAELKRVAFLKRKQEIIEQLRQHSTISVDQQQWQSCLDTLKE